MKRLNRIYRIAQVNKNKRIVAWDVGKRWNALSSTRWQPTRLCPLIFVIDASMQWEIAPSAIIFSHRLEHKSIHLGSYSCASVVPTPLNARSLNGRPASLFATR
jgi:hypothetical protein